MLSCECWESDTQFLALLVRKCEVDVDISEMMWWCGLFILLVDKLTWKIWTSREWVAASLPLSETTVLWPLCRSFVGCCHLLRSRVFCWRKVLLHVCHCWRHLMHSDKGEVARVFVEGVIYSIFILPVLDNCFICSVCNRACFSHVRLFSHQRAHRWNSASWSWWLTPSPSVSVFAVYHNCFMLLWLQ